MKKLLSEIDIPEHTSFYEPDTGIYLLEKFSLDGFGLVCCGNDMNIFSRKNIIDLYLPFFADWVNLWLEDYKSLDQKSGSRAARIVFRQLKRS